MHPRFPHPLSILSFIFCLCYFPTFVVSFALCSSPTFNKTVRLAMSSSTTKMPAPFIKNCIVEVDPDRAQEFIDICSVAQAKSLQEEPGCLRLDFLQVTDADTSHAITNKFIVYEIFEDEAAYQFHKQQPYTQPIKAFVESGGCVHEDAYVAKSLFLSE